MTTLQDIERALRNADAAGDVEAAQLLARAYKDMAAKQSNPIAQGAGNLVAGAVRGAGSIGATLLSPKDAIENFIARKMGAPELQVPDRRAGMDSALQGMGAEPDSALYKTSKTGTEIFGTLGAGGATANLLGRTALAAKAPQALEAIRTAGMTGGGLPTRALGGAVNGAVSAGLVNPEDAGTGALIGGVLPGATKAAGWAGSKVGSAIRGEPVSAEVAALANRAKTLGIEIPADRLVNSRPLDAVASALNYVPFSGRAATEANMGSQLNQALSKTFGENTSNVTQALRNADYKLGGKFDAFLKNNTVVIDKQFLQDLADASNRAAKELGTDGAKVIQNQVDELIAKGANGQIDGQAAYNIKKTLDRIGRRNSPEAWYALDLKKSLMDALNRTVGPQEAKAFAELRQQYGNMLDLQKLAKNGVEGEVSVARLANMKNIKNDQMQELADIAAQFVKPRESQHGAMQRAVVGLGTAGIAGLPGLVGGAAVGRATNAALNSDTARRLILGGMPSLLSDEAIQYGYRAAPGLLTAGGQ